jgi:hypothetical protein
MPRWVVVYRVQEAIVVDAPDELVAKARAVAVLRNGAPTRHVEIIRAEKG